MGELGGVVSGVVAAAVAGAKMVVEARGLLLADAFSGRRDGISLGALSCVGASTSGVLSGVVLRGAKGIETGAMREDSAVRALDGVAVTEIVKSVQSATTA